MMFLIFPPTHLIIIKLKMFQHFSKMLQHFFFNVSSNFLSTFYKCSNIFLVNIFLEASSNIFLETSSNIFLEASSNFSSTFYKCSNIFYSNIFLEASSNIFLEVSSTFFRNVPTFFKNVGQHFFLFLTSFNIYKNCWFRQLFFNILQNVATFLGNVGFFYSSYLLRPAARPPPARAGKLAPAGAGAVTRGGGLAAHRAACKRGRTGPGPASSTPWPPWRSGPLAAALGHAGRPRAGSGCPRWATGRRAAGSGWRWRWQWRWATGREGAAQGRWKKVV
jgi:hypothetical protein